MYIATVITPLEMEMTYDNLLAAMYDGSKEMFVLKHSDGAMSYFPREAVIQFSFVEDKRPNLKVVDKEEETNVDMGKQED